MTYLRLTSIGFDHLDGDGDGYGDGDNYGDGCGVGLTRNNLYSSETHNFGDGDYGYGNAKGNGELQRS